VATNTAIVTLSGCVEAPNDYCPATVYTLTGGLWVESAYLSPAPGSGDFGSSVAISPDGNTVFVGDRDAACSANASDRCGAVDIYVKPAGGWQSTTPTAQLTVSTAANTELGSRMLASGTTLFAIGTVTCAAPVNTCGAVYVFTQPAGGWAATTATATLTTPGGFSFEGGQALAYDAGASTLAASFGGDVVYLFQGTAGNFTSGGQTAELSSSALGIIQEETAGNALAISGGVVAEGIPGQNGDSAGLALVWVEPAGGWQDISAETAQLGPDLSSSFKLTLQLGTGVVIDGSTIYVSGAAGNIFVYPEPAGGWASETESSTLGSSTDLLAGGPMVFSGSSVVQERSSCDSLDFDACAVAQIYPLPPGSVTGSAPVFWGTSIQVANAQHSSSSIPVVLAGKQVQLDFNIYNLGLSAADGLTLSFAQPASTSGFATDSGTCSTSGSLLTCPAGSMDGSTNGGPEMTFTAPATRGTFTLAATLATASPDWDPLDNQTSIQVISDNPPVPQESNLIIPVAEGTIVNSQIPVTDADGDTLTFTQSFGTQHGTLNLQANGQFTYAPSSATYVGSDEFDYTVSDGLLNVNGTVTINLQAPTPPTPPTVSAKNGGGDLGLLPLGTLLLLWRRRAAGRDTT
jgi:VCBS repeat-containing protein